MDWTGGLAARPNGSGKSIQRPEHSVLLSFISRLILGTVAPILVALCMSTGTVCAQVAAGHVTSLIGNASIQRAGSSLVVSVGMTVQVADQVVVSDGGKVTITLSDGSLLEVGSSSTIVIDEELLGPGGARASTRVHLLTGILRSVAKHTSGSTLPNFEVRTPNAILAARGTTFDTQYTSGTRRSGYGTATQFTDERTLIGTVAARNAIGGQEVSVPAGYEITIAGDAAPTSPGPINSTGIPWKGGERFTATEPAPGMGVGGAGAASTGTGIAPGVVLLPPTVGVISPPPPPPPPPPIVPPSLPAFPR
jgi:FecR protein